MSDKNEGLSSINQGEAHKKTNRLHNEVDSFNININMESVFYFSIRISSIWIEPSDSLT